MATQKSMTCTVVLKNSLYEEVEDPEDVEYIVTSPDDPVTVSLAGVTTITTITPSDSVGKGTRTISAIYGKEKILRNSTYVTTASTDVNMFSLAASRITVDVTRSGMETIMKIRQRDARFFERMLSFAKSQFKIKC